ncbi:MAG: protein kinase [Planctomycetota bacterium]
MSTKREYEFIIPRSSVLQPGKEIGDRYVIKRMLGEGGMSTVYLAKDKILDIDVAIKMLYSVLSKNKQAIDTLREEARLTASLSHPNIVHLYNIEQIDDYNFIVMEFVDGPTLQDIMDERRKLSQDEIINYAKGIASALDHAHEADVLHRDVKPTNIMIDRKGNVKLTDFGIARKMKDQVLRLTGELRTGTPPYMAPEQLMGDLIDRKSDIYSFGVVIHECFSGTTPFSTGAVEVQIMLKPAPPLNDVPENIKNAVLRALSKAPNQRYNSAGDFYAALTGEHILPLEAEEKQIPRTAVRKRPDQEPPRVLVVDDEDDIRILLSSFLESINYNYVNAMNGEEALEAILKSSFDLVILDLYMPRMNGFQFLRRMRIEGIDTPVIILTASPLEQDMLSSYRIGANYYLSKPFSAKKLKDVITYFVENISDEERQNLESRI